MCWKLLLSLLVGYNNNEIRPHVLHIAGKNTELGPFSIHQTNSYYEKEKYCGFDKRTNDMYDSNPELAVNISKYLEIVKHIKYMKSVSDNFEFIEKDEKTATILHDFFDYNSIGPMRIKNGGLSNKSLLYDW